MHRAMVFRFVIACAGLSALLSAGCGGPGDGAAVSPVSDEGYPDWVRIVPAGTDDVSYYVGAVALARDPESGLEKAEGDAVAQAEEAARMQFVRRFDAAATGAGVETTSEERLEFRTNIASDLARLLGPAVEREDAFYRYCEGGDGGQPSAGGPVCELFVLVRLDHAERDRILNEALASLGEKKQREGQTKIAQLIEWMLRNP